MVGSEGFKSSRMLFMGVDLRVGEVYAGRK